MRLLFPGAVIRRERLRRSWSQEGLCRGICAVSYLSKIEQGKTAVSPEILQMLFARLKLPWYDDPETMAAAQSLVERCYEALFSGDQKVLDPLREEFSAQEERISNSPFALDGALLRGLLAYPRRPADRGLEPFFDQRQLALQRLLEGRHEEAMRLYPCAYISLTAGIGEYEGGNDIGALDYLRRAYDMAAGDGAVRIMLSAKIYMGNWYCNRIDIENMDIQYRVAERLARALGAEGELRDIRYNRASTWLETGLYDKAYSYFSQAERPNILALHKLAICCEKLGRREEALAALDRTAGMESEFPETPLVQQMCGLVRFRLEHEDYLQHHQYGERLLHVFDRCRRELPIGYASFHLPWVLEWYTANRQYRAAYELVQGFPIKLHLN